MDPSNYVACPAGREAEQRLALAWTRLPTSRAASPGCLHPGTSTARASRLHLTSEAWPLLGKSEEHSSRSVREAGMVQANAAVQRASKTSLLEPVQPSVTGVAVWVPAPWLSYHSGNATPPSSLPCSFRARGPTADSLCDLDIHF